MASSVRRAVIVLSILDLLILVMFPVRSQAQMVLSAGAILRVLVHWPLRRHRLTRYIFLALGSVIVMRYLFWRSYQSLLAMRDAADFSAGLVLLLAEIFCIALFFTNLFIVMDLIKRADAPLLSEEACLRLMCLCLRTMKTAPYWLQRFQRPKRPSRPEKVADAKLPPRTDSALCPAQRTLRRP